MNWSSVADSPTCLYIGNLNPTVTEAELRVKLNTVGPLTDIFIQRKMGTTHYLRYAYVNYRRKEDAEKAFTILQWDDFKGQPLLILWANQISFKPENDSCGKVYIQNLPPVIDDNRLRLLFSRYGEISFCKVSRDENGSSRGYGFVYFETDQEANDAVQKFNGKTIDGIKISVVKFCRRNLSLETAVEDDASDNDFDDDEDDDFDDDEDDDYQDNNVFIKNFGDSLNDDSLKDLFAPFGEITSHKVKTNDKGVSLGFGFVAFKTSKSAKTAIQVMNGKEFKSHVLFVALHQSKAERERLHKLPLRELRCNLFVKNLAENIDDQILKRIFSRYGDVTSAKVMRNKDGGSKGHGFVCFQKYDSAKEAKESLHGKRFYSKEIYVSFAQKKEDREALLKLRNSVKSDLKKLSISK